MAKYVKTEEGYKEIETVNGNKMNINNPVGAGSFSMGRKAGSVIGTYSHAEGYNTTSSGIYSHAEGGSTTASGSGSHAEGYSTTASGVDSHAEGIDTTASGDYAHAEGLCTIASGDESHVEGKYNIEDTANKYAHIVGNGTSNSRSNAHTLDWNGVGWFKDSVKVGGSSQDDSAAKTLATTDYVNTLVGGKVDKVDGKGLSTNDYTTDEKNKLAGIEAGANKTVVDTALSSTSTNPVQNKVVNTALAGKAASSHSHSAADITSGTLPITRGGTGATIAADARTNLGFTYGTAEPTATPSTGNGSIYFMEDDGSPLSIAEGGTGASTASAALTNLGLNRIDVTPTLSTANNVDESNSGGNIRIFPGLRLAILRCGVVTKKQFSAGYTYIIATIPDEYAPASSFGLGVYTENGLVNARYNASNKSISVRIKETVASGSSIYVSGVMYY